MSPTSVLLRAEARRYMADAEQAQDSDAKRTLSGTAFLLAQIAEAFDRTGVIPERIIKQLDGKARVLAESIAYGESVRITRLK